MYTRITGLEIEGFRAIRSRLTLDLRDPSHRPLDRIVIAGTNGGGKTSILEAILVALGREELIIRDLPADQRGDRWRVEIPPGARIVVHGRVTLAAGANHAEEFTIVRTSDGWSSNYMEYLQGIPVEYFSSWRAPVLPGGLQPTTRGRQSADNEANRLRQFKQRIVNERARHAFARGVLPTQSQDASWLNAINAVWRAFHDDGSTIEADVVDPAADDPLFDLFVFDGKTRRCSIDQISSGELELVTLAGTLVLARQGGLVLIDEPELHLHREWQTRLIDVLTTMSPSSQLIIATHADAPWDQVLSFERFFLARPGDPCASTGTSQRSSSTDCT